MSNRTRSLSFWSWFWIVWGVFVSGMISNVLLLHDLRARPLPVELHEEARGTCHLANPDTGVVFSWPCDGPDSLPPE